MQTDRFIAFAFACGFGFECCWCSKQTIFRRINHEIVNLTFYFQAFCICLMNYIQRQTIQLVCECVCVCGWQLYNVLTASIKSYVEESFQVKYSHPLCSSYVCFSLSSSSFPSSSPCFCACLYFYFCLFMSPFFAFVLINFMFGLFECAIYNRLQKQCLFCEAIKVKITTMNHMKYQLSQWLTRCYFFVVVVYIVIAGNGTILQRVLPGVIKTKNGKLMFTNR